MYEWFACKYVCALSAGSSHRGQKVATEGIPWDGSYRWLYEAGAGSPILALCPQLCFVLITQLAWGTHKAP